LGYKRGRNVTEGDIVEVRVNIYQQKGGWLYDHLMSLRFDTFMLNKDIHMKLQKYQKKIYIHELAIIWNSL
jgi:hypothetical protein